MQNMPAWTYSRLTMILNELVLLKLESHLFLSFAPCLSDTILSWLCGNLSSSVLCCSLYFFGSNWGRERYSFTAADFSLLDASKSFEMNLTISLWFTGSHLEGSSLPQFVDVRTEHGQGICFFSLQRHSKQRDEWCYTYQGVTIIPSIFPKY